MFDLKENTTVSSCGGKNKPESLSQWDPPHYMKNMGLREFQWLTEAQINHRNNLKSRSSGE